MARSRAEARVSREGGADAGVTARSNGKRKVARRPAGSMCSGDSGAGPSGVKRGRAFDPEEVPRSHARVKKKAKRECAICGRDSTCMWYRAGTDSVKCAACYQKAHNEAVKRANPGLRCSSCGKDTTSMWYGIGTDSVKCNACYQKAHNEALKQSHPCLQCSSCGKDTTSHWYGVGTDSVKCRACYDKAYREAYNKSHPGLQCSSCGQDTTSHWYGVGTDSVKCNACYNKARREAVKQSNPRLRCNSCGKDTTSTWYGVGTDSVKCAACYAKARKEAVKQSHPGLQCSSCGKDSTCSQWYGVGTDRVKCDACYKKARYAAKKQREKMQDATQEPEPAVHSPSDGDNGGSKAPPSRDTEQQTMAAAAELRRDRAEGQGSSKTNKRFSQRFLTDAEIPNDLYLRFAPGMGGLPTLKKPFFKLLRTTVVRKVIRTVLNKLPKGPHRLDGPGDLELLSNTDVLPLSMTMSALLQGEGGTHEPPRCEWRRGVENGVEVEKLIIDVSYRVRRVKVKVEPS